METDRLNQINNNDNPYQSIVLNKVSNNDSNVLAKAFIKEKKIDNNNEGDVLAKSSMREKKIDNDNESNQKKIILWNSNAE